MVLSTHSTDSLGLFLRAGRVKLGHISALTGFLSIQTVASHCREGGKCIGRYGIRDSQLILESFGARTSPCKDSKATQSLGSQTLLVKGVQFYSFPLKKNTSLYPSLNRVDAIELCFSYA